MPVNEAEFARSHLPGLLDNSGHRQPDKIARAMAVQVDLRDARLGGVHGHAAFLGIDDRSFAETRGTGAKKNWLGLLQTFRTLCIDPPAEFVTACDMLKQVDPINM